MPTEAELQAEVEPLLEELSHRRNIARRNEQYYRGRPPLPPAVVRARMTNSYETLMPAASAPWGSVVVDSVLDRLEPSGISSDDRAADERLWRDVWQANSLDEEAILAHDSALLNGRAFATVWPNGEHPEITLDGASEVIVKYAEGSRRHRALALRNWTDDDDREHFTLHRPDGTYKFSAAKGGRGSTVRARGKVWERREPEGEPWPIPNRLGLIPVVELAVNRRLKPGSYPPARGEFEHCWGLLDRIHLLTFLGLVVAIWMGFPLRGIIGEKIVRDDDDKPIPPFDADAGGLAQLENKDVKTFEFTAADRDNLSIFGELMQLAYVTKTPAHYFPLESGLSNISADAIRALEGGLHAKVQKHKGSLGGGWEDVLRLAGLMLPTPIDLSPSAALDWQDHESRSMAERADAASKVASLGLPWQWTAQHYLNATQEDIRRIEAQVAGTALGDILRAAQQPVVEPINEEPELALQSA